MKLTTAVFSSLLFAGLLFGQKAEQQPEDSEISPQELGISEKVSNLEEMKQEDLDDPATRANTVVFQILCANHVEVLTGAVKSQQIQIETLSKRVSELLMERENIRLSQAVQPQSESYRSSIREALTEAGADPERCRIEDLISGEITCVVAPAAATEPR